eukprot:PITA_00037
MSDAPEYRCFVGGLSWSTSDRTLEDAFHKFGHLIEAKVVVDRDTGRSRGFGFVTFDDKKSMEDAIDSMHGMSLDGRSITVDRARPKSDGEDRGDRGDRGYGGGGGRGYSGGGGNSECFKCGQRGHFARECPNGDGYRGGGGDRYGSRSDRYGGGSRSSKYGSDRNGGGGDRYGGRSRDGGSRSGKDDRYNRDRSGPYDRPSGGGRSYDDRD